MFRNSTITDLFLFAFTQLIVYYQLNGRFLLISGDNYVYTSADIEEIEYGPNQLDETLVAIELPLQNTDIDSTALLSSIIDAGEKIAAHDMISISKASFPSKNIKF